MTAHNAHERLRFLADYLSANGNHLVIDGDTHPTDVTTLTDAISTQYQSTDYYYQGRPISPQELIDSMDSAGVDMSLTWQNPAAFQYSDDQEWNFQRLLKANRDIASFATEHPKRFIPAGWTDPKSLGVENAQKLAEICIKELGFPIVKMNPAQNAYPIDSPMVSEVVHTIADLGATPAFHFGGDSPYTPASGLLKIAKELGDHPVIGVHMGGGGSHFVDGDETYLGAREIGLESPNIFYIMSAKREAHMESALILYTRKGVPFCNNLNWGSDAPYGLQCYNLSGLKSLLNSLSQNRSVSGKLDTTTAQLFNGPLIDGFLGGNLAKLVLNSCERILQKNF